MKNTDTIISLNRLDGALKGHGVKLKRNQLLQVAASAYGHRNVHELAAADAAGDLAPPKARYMGRSRVAKVGWMHFFQQPDGVVFAVDQEAIDGREKRAGKWILSPTAGLLDISDLTDDRAVSADASPQRGIEGVMDALRTGPGSYEVEADDGGSPWLVDVGGAVFNPSIRFDAGNLGYMTNATCEIGGVTKGDLDRLSLESGEFDGEFYPLTERENEFIADDVIVSADGLKTALMGYSVLYHGRKHAMPTIEMPVGADHDAPDHETVLADARAYAERIAPKVDKYNGEVLIDETMPDRICIGLAIPFTMITVDDYDDWAAKVAWLMVDTALPTVIDGRYPIRHESTGIAVDVSWIGEGLDGDYDPTEDEDHPLLRYDVQRLVEGEWEDVDGGSYCTQVHAYCAIDTARALAAYLVGRIEENDGDITKRFLGTLSWTKACDIEATEAAIKAARERGDDDYVSHRTYGDPDSGTSVDLRRRSDGSVRCEVYVDLNCADVFEGSDIGEVRRHLKTLPCDMERAEGDPLPSFAMAPQWDTLDPASIRWMLVPQSESETDWFADHAENAPFDPAFVRIDDMTV